MCYCCTDCCVSICVCCEKVCPCLQSDANPATQYLHPIQLPRAAKWCTAPMVIVVIIMLALGSDEHIRQLYEDTEAGGYVAPTLGLTFVHSAAVSYCFCSTCSWAVVEDGFCQWESDVTLNQGDHVSIGEKPHQVRYSSLHVLHC